MNHFVINPFSDLYNVSCREIDTIIEITRNVDGVFGARMTGGGFGGCVVALVSLTNGHLMTPN